MLQEFEDEVIDLIYLDPPFFSNRKYEVIWKDGYEIRAFEDRWKGGIEHYIGWMQPRLEQCYRVLKKTGSMYLHCNWYANAHLRILMDRIFTRDIKCEIIWNKGFRGTERKRNWQQSHDTILFYTKSDDYTWNDQYQDYADKDLKRYNKIDDHGKQYARIKRRKTDGTVYYGKSYPKVDGKRINDVISIPLLAATAKERLGYPTQKPEVLLERIIEASSNKGDIVLDPFCGCGTTIALAQRLQRAWIGMDVSPAACRLMLERIRKIYPNATASSIIGLPRTRDEWRSMNPFDFQSTVCLELGARVSEKKSGDMGIDGWLIDGTPIQIKRSERIGRNVIDNFETALRRVNKKKGIVVAFSFGKGTYEEVARAKQEEGIEIELKTVNDLRR